MFSSCLRWFFSCRCWLAVNCACCSRMNCMVRFISSSNMVPSLPAILHKNRAPGSFNLKAARREVCLLNRVCLFHRHRFGEVARLVHVAAAAHRDVVGEKLEGDDGE